MKSDKLRRRVLNRAPHLSCLASLLRRHRRSQYHAAPWEMCTAVSRPQRQARRTQCTAPPQRAASPLANAAHSGAARGQMRRHKRTRAKEAHPQSSVAGVPVCCDADSLRGRSSAMRTLSPMWREAIIAEKVTRSSRSAWLLATTEAGLSAVGCLLRLLRRPVSAPSRRSCAEHAGCARCAALTIAESSRRWRSKRHRCSGAHPRVAAAAPRATLGQQHESARRYPR